MYTPLSPWIRTGIRPESADLAATKQHIEKQLAAVVQLSEHNAHYLEGAERAWIEHIISEAVSMLSCDPQDMATSCLQQPVKTSSTFGGLRENTDPQQITPWSWSPFHVAAEDYQKALIVASKNLNSANSLLSCCYDRWLWLQSSPTKRDDSQIHSDDLRELLGRRRRRQRSSSHVPPRFPEHLRPYQSDTTSPVSPRIATTSNDGSENSLSLTVDDTVERWRQNAEDALNEATARLGASDVNPYRLSTQQHSEIPHICRQCMTECENPSFTSGNDATAVQACNVKRPLTQRLSMHSSRTSIRHSESARTGVTGAAHERYSLGRTPSTELLEERRIVRPVFSSTLHNSFDKEAVDVARQIVSNVTPNISQTAATIYSSPCLRSGLVPVSQTNSIVQQTTRIFTDLRHDSTSGPIGRDGPAIHTLPSTNSATSVQSRSSEDRLILRSRGRRWLEQQSDRIITTT